MVKTKDTQKTGAEGPSPAVRPKSPQILTLDDVFAPVHSQPPPPPEEPPLRFYDLGPGGRLRNLGGTGTPVVFTHLKTEPETGVWSKFPLYERFVRWRMMNSTQGKPDGSPQKQTKKKRPTKRCVRKPKPKPKPQFFNLYRLLNVAVNSSKDELKAAYRKRLLATHPDKGGCTEEFTMIKAAYDVLSNDAQRHTYDEFGLEGLLECDPFFDTSKFLRH